MMETKVTRRLVRLCLLSLVDGSGYAFEGRRRRILVCLFAKAGVVAFWGLGSIWGPECAFSLCRLHRRRRDSLVGCSVFVEKLAIFGLRALGRRT